MPHYIIAPMSRGLRRSTMADATCRPLVPRGQHPRHQRDLGCALAGGRARTFLGRAFAELNALPPSCDGTARHGVGWCPAASRQRLSPRFSPVTPRPRLRLWPRRVPQALSPSELAFGGSDNDNCVNGGWGGMQLLQFCWLFDVATASVPPKIPPWRGLSALGCCCPYLSRSCGSHRSLTAGFRSILAHQRRATPPDLDQGGAAAETIRAPCTCKRRPVRARS